MRKNCMVLLLLALSLTVEAQYRVKERSERRMPEWVSGVERNFLIVSGTAATLEQSKEAAMAQLRGQVVSSIATRVSTESHLTTEQLNMNGNINYMEHMESSISSRAANIPFVKSLSISKASDFYWEYLYDKKEKRYFYEYHLKYPFSDKELQTLVEQFNERERELDLTLEGYKESLNNVGSVEEIDQQVNNLRGFIHEFEQDDSRFQETNQLINSYLNLYKSIRMEVVSSQKEQLVIALFLGDRVITCSRKPLVRSNCATEFAIQIGSNGTVAIGYDDFNCYPDDKNYIEVRYVLGYQTLFNRFYITL